MSIETELHSSALRHATRTKISVHETEYLTIKARIASDLIARWGMVAGIVDGEDSAGRSKLRLATPDEVVTRAVETTRKMFEAFESKDWIHQLPTLKEAAIQADILYKKESALEDSALEDSMIE